MKELYTNLKCPYCGAASFILMEDDIFLCEYCQNKFHFDLDNMSKDNKNKIFIEEYTSFFNEKIIELEQLKIEYRKKLKIYSIKETQRGVEHFSMISLIVSIVMLFAIIELPVIAIFSALGIILYILAKIYRKKMYQKYHPIVTHYAAIIADCDSKINTYVRFVSKVTK